MVATEATPLLISAEAARSLEGLKTLSNHVSRAAYWLNSERLSDLAKSFDLIQAANDTAKRVRGEIIGAKDSLLVGFGLLCGLALLCAAVAVWAVFQIGEGTQCTGQCNFNLKIWLILHIVCCFALAFQLFTTYSAISTVGTFLEDVTDFSETGRARLRENYNGVASLPWKATFQLWVGFAGYWGIWIFTGIVVVCGVIAIMLQPYSTCCSWLWYLVLALIAWHCIRMLCREFIPMLIWSSIPDAKTLLVGSATASVNESADKAAAERLTDKAAKTV
eukprot:gnl/TRDRNA2_/TRDRNA2_181983_c0_seq1.p1 gnl/TRDRNA2_/TRDRNA2_181983_c0~~gnl/TRDRNA2_/TRDRNA2_181983_c0_seq1.p1  ORF type:complete len:277 (+),score=34.80 gnl/TRDRNA2_/TRDRNA2_181983_c0_seq1:112-942(+)